MKLENLEVKRVTIHKIFAKSKTIPEPYADDCTELVKLGDEGLKTLHDRIKSCLNHKSKFFELHIADLTDKENFFNIQKPLWNSEQETFLEISQKIADKAAFAHKNANIPDGLLVVIECLISNLKCVVVIKAEKSDAFSMTGTNLQLIKDIFLSSDKALYKIGFTVHHNEKGNETANFRYFVYDDSFSPSKEDLAYYFYHTFLGFSTERNSKLQTNKLHKQLTKFALKHIGYGDRYGVLKNIDRVFLEPKNTTLNAKDFSTFFPEEAQGLFVKEVEEHFPTAFVKDTAITTTISTKRIELTSETTLLLKNAPDGVITGSTDNKEDIQKLKTSIDSGSKYNFALIPVEKVNPNS
ncbi:nucleoid-associated protein [Pseudanabaena galeata UHCC 0370]|uniref:Nucleoid-associated protein n=1 Tax=Pseudanabaena galeata UHCC 0370 TaxID=3110310 RepID=A0ABU5TJE3_9CYAN|nr:nucleoid-associated protein [Pseudanabaena galeata]MEA5478143.1 nucleoid-associated protein [Pseudanabaena galeata UHCC 0370]